MHRIHKFVAIPICSDDVMSVFKNLLLACGLMAVAVIAKAQDDPAAFQRMTVTGTRLEAEQLATPITRIEREELLASGALSIGRFLQALPMMAGAPLGTTVGARDSGGGFSRGIETVELRGLGASRTLVLVNGRRFVAGGNGAGGVVDLAMIPTAMVERIEILRHGASVEYGADAVAGVVNIITRQAPLGLQLSANGSVTDRSDAQSAAFSAVYGGQLGAADVMLGAEFFDQQPVSKGARGFSSQLLTVSGESNEIVPDGSSAPPLGNFRIPSSGDRVTLIDGEDGDVADDFRPWVSRGENNDRFNFNPFEDLLQESRRRSLFALARQPVGTRTEVFVETLYQQRDSFTRLAPLPFFTNRLAGVSVSADNVFNPFSEEITDARRRLVEGGARGFAQDNTAWRVVVGAQGEWGAWQWDASINQARNRMTQHQYGDLLADRVALALGPSFTNNAGQPVCGTQDAPIAGCVPLNLFGGPGSITPEMLSYTGLSRLTDEFENEQSVFSANLRGDLFTFPTGAVAAALGYEYRDERAQDTPDVQTQAGSTTGAARQSTRGRFHSQELYAEIGVPLLSNNRMHLDFGMRAIDFSNFDNELVFDSALQLAPSADLALRIAYSQAFRAPTINELFGGVSQSNPAVDDPCADFSQLGQSEIDRCVAQGVPADGRFDQSGNETPQLGGGNPDLGAEKADVLTAGVSWSPSALPGLSMSVSFYDIRIDNGIAALGANTILDQCLATGSVNFCDRISRDADGNILQVRAELQNIASERARGLDFDLRYRIALAGGLLTPRLMLSHVLERELKAFPNAEPFVGEGEFDPDNFGAIPKWKGHLALDWKGQRWSLGYAAQWIGGLRESGGEIFPATVNSVTDRVYHDLRAGWMISERAHVSFGIDNLLDRDPPFLANGDVANTDVATYRLLGRTLRLQLSYTLP